MKQLSFLATEYDALTNLITWSLYSDGAARGNPGPAGAGIYLLRNGEPFAGYGFFLGTKTNNQAEYLALLLGLFYIARCRGNSDTLIIYSDSELIVKHMQGNYAVKSAALRPLYECAKSHLVSVDYQMCHIPRAKNAIADRFANDGINKKNAVPEDFLTFCSW
jgi:ribonuclease HI